MLCCFVFLPVWCLSFVKSCSFEFQVKGLTYSSVKQNMNMRVLPSNQLMLITKTQEINNHKLKTKHNIMT